MTLGQFSMRNNVDPGRVLICTILHSILQKGGESYTHLDTDVHRMRAEYAREVYIIIHLSVHPVHGCGWTPTCTL